MIPRLTEPSVLSSAAMPPRIQFIHSCTHQQTCVMLCQQVIGKVVSRVEYLRSLLLVLLDLLLVDILLEVQPGVLEIPGQGACTENTQSAHETASIP